MAKYILLLLIFFTACKDTKITLPKQDFNHYQAKSFKINDDVAKKLKENYLAEFFGIWDKQKTNINMQSFAKAVQNTEWFGENYQKTSSNQIQNLIKKAAFDKINSLNLNAIIINHTNVRLLPTLKPNFKNPKIAGEGYPFDYLQNSYINAFTPVKISHFSNDLAWAFIYNNYIVGFVKTSDIALINENTMNEYKSSKDFAFSTNDGVILKDSSGFFAIKSRIGMLLAIDKEDENYYYFKTFKKDFNSKAKIQITKANKNNFIKLGKGFSSDDIKALASDLLGDKYGWGGLNGNRDCSALMQDIFASFGIYLKRNSQDQIRQNDYLKRELFQDISHLSKEEKYKYIKKHAIAFASLLALKGHIVLYIGEYNNNLYILHNFWGVKNYHFGKEGRIIIGKVVITPIDIGNGIAGVKDDDLIINKIYGIRNLFSEELQ